ncbi:MAG: DNA repair protein RecO [Jatrophihabitans sp.]
MPLYRDDAVVLRVHKLGEADRIITLLTRRHGRIRAVGKGVRRTTSKFGARLEPGMQIDVQLLTRNAQGADAPANRKLDTVTQTESIASYGAQIAADYRRWTAVSAICETAERLTSEEGEPALRLYLLVVGALRTLAERDREPGLVLDAFLLRAMSTAGWEPALRDCAVCGAPGPHEYFNVAAGGAVCPNCRPTGSARPPAGTIELMADLMEANWDGAEAAAADACRAANGLVAAHLQWHLERGLRSLPLVDRTESAPPTSRDDQGEPRAVTLGSS